MVQGPSLTPRLMEAARASEAAASAAGLSFFEVVFEMLDAADVNAVAAYGGFPVRYASWRFGMEYERLARGHDWGLSKIYELVINHDPTVAYLVRSNSLLEQKLVMAHVFGHADFFRNNAWFAPTDRGMLERFDEHARRVQGHAAERGQGVVERFMDAALALEPLVDPYGPMKRSRGGALGSRAPAPGGSHSARSHAALESILDGAPRAAAPPPPAKDSPFDVLRFLVERAPLEGWERDLLGVVAAEAEYFLPQRMTKIINEGWASFWHSRLLTGGLLDASEVVDFADCHSGATSTAPGQLNPYKRGIDLFRRAEERGIDLFRLRSVHNDVTFIDEVMDAEFIQRCSLFVRREERDGPRIGTRDPDEVKGALLQSLAWGGSPRIRLDGVEDGALLLVHEHDGRDLKLDEAGEMVRTIERLWRAPVRLRTREKDEECDLVCESGELRMAS